MSTKAAAHEVTPWRPTRPNWPELLDELRDDERSDRQQHHHRSTHDQEPHQVSGEIRHAVEGNGRVTRLDHHAAARPSDDLVAGSQRQLHRPDRGLVAPDAGLRHGAGRGWSARRGSRPGGAHADWLAVAVASLLAALLAHRASKSRSSETPHGK